MLLIFLFSNPSIPLHGSVSSFHHHFYLLLTIYPLLWLAPARLALHTFLICLRVHQNADLSILFNLSPIRNHFPFDSTISLYWTVQNCQLRGWLRDKSKLAIWPATQAVNLYSRQQIPEGPLVTSAPCSFMTPSTLCWVESSFLIAILQLRASASHIHTLSRSF